MTKYVWCDIETTGLDPREDQILEICMTAPTSSPFATGIARAFVLEYRGAIKDDFVFKMHSESGLLQECRSGLPLAKVICLLSEALGSDRHGETFVMCGSSVHFDLNFIRHHMPSLASFFSHRVFDVSAMAMLAREMGMPSSGNKKSKHRGLSDVMDSFEYLNQIREFFQSRSSQAW